MPDMDYSAARFWWDIIQTIAIIFAALYTYLRNRSTVNREYIQELKDEITVHSEKIALLKKELELQPSRQDLEMIYSKVNRVSEGLHNLEGKLDGINRSLGLINEHLLKGK